VRYLDADLPSIMLDEQTLEAALVNLVKNALEAMPDGGRLEARTRLTPSRSPRNCSIVRLSERHGS
jgi:nitrogen-specific signal transduction histidine kinase